MSEEQTSDSDLVVATLLCPICDADVIPDTEICLRCGFRYPDSTVNPFESPSAMHEINSGTGSASTVVSLLLTVGLFAVLIAVFFSSPGLGICLALMTIPPWIRTTLVIFKRAKSGLKTDNIAKASLFVGSAFITWLILSVSVVTCCLTFCAACWAVIIIQPPSKGGLDDVLGWTLIGVVVVTFSLILLAFSPWIRSRWIKDTTRER